MSACPPDHNGYGGVQILKSGSINVFDGGVLVDERLIALEALHVCTACGATLPYTDEELIAFNNPQS